MKPRIYNLAHVKRAMQTHRDATQQIVPADNGERGEDTDLAPPENSLHKNPDTDLAPGPD